MAGLSIQAEHLSKKYEIAVGKDRHDTLRDQISAGVRGLLRQNAGGRKTTESFWALKDMSFDVRQGEVLGIIGRNGAGKSTLLKILSRITQPTSGRARLYGRIASLLEVGTGFHGELTGRENIYLNGALLGMKRSEIDRKFDAIVDFSGVERFLDTPVKRYSSGMYVRLAFGVAAHLDPEILIVDEVLAVGDASFQKKCLNRMQDVSQEGRTVLFVSHNMQTITRLCKRVLLLDQGTIFEDGSAQQVVGTYLRSGLGVTGVREYGEGRSAPGNDIVRVHAVRVRDADGASRDMLDIQSPVGIEMEFEILTPGHVLTPCYGFNNEEGVTLFIASDRDPEWQRRPRPVGRYVSTAWIPANLLAEGTITVGAGVITEDPFTIHCDDETAVAFQMVDGSGTSTTRGDFAGHIPGVVRPALKWETQYSPKSREARVVG
jgi:lipopolysaccharide transport system ATP-binding protein